MHLQARQAEAFRLCHFSLTIRILLHAQRASALLIIPVTAFHYKSTTDVSELSSKYTDFLQNAFINSAQIYLSICNDNILVASLEPVINQFKISVDLGASVNIPCTKSKISENILKEFWHQNFSIFSPDFEEFL